MAIFTAAATALSAAFGFAAGSVGAAIVSFGVNAVGSLATSALAAGWSGGGSAQEQLIGITGQPARGADLSASFVFGDWVTEGQEVYRAPWTPAGASERSYYAMVIALADLPLQSLNGVRIDGVECTIGDTPHPDYGYPVAEYRRKGRDHVWLRFYDGNQTAADPTMVNLVSREGREWDATAVGYGVAYVVVIMRGNRNLFSGIPQFVFEVTGCPLYDPSRDSSVGGVGPQRFDDPATWGGDGDNLPAVQAYALARGLEWGGKWFYGLQGVASGQLPVSSWIAAIEKCREQVDRDGAGGAEARFSSGGEFQVGASLSDAMQKLVDACGGRFIDSGGIFELQAAGVGNIAASFSDLDILASEPEQLTPIAGLSDTVNAVSANFVDPASGWRPQASPVLYDEDAQARDGSQKPVRVDLHCVSSGAQAQRLQKLALLEARRARRHVLVLSSEFSALRAGSFVEWSSADHGFNQKIFRVERRASFNGGNVALDIVEVDPSDHAFDPAVDFTQVVPPAVPPLDVPLVEASGITFAKSQIVDGDDTARRAAILMQWFGDLDDIAAIAFEVRLVASATIVSMGRVDVDGAGSTLISDGILGAQEYEARARYVPAGRADSEWSGWFSVITDPVTLDASELPPIGGAEISAELAQAIADGEAAADAVEGLTATAEIQRAVALGAAGFTDPTFATGTDGDTNIAGSVLNGGRAYDAAGVRDGGKYDKTLYFKASDTTVDIKNRNWQWRTTQDPVLALTTDDTLVKCVIEIEWLGGSVGVGTAVRLRWTNRDNAYFETIKTLESAGLDVTKTGVQRLEFMIERPSDWEEGSGATVKEITLQFIAISKLGTDGTAGPVEFYLHLLDLRPVTAQSSAGLAYGAKATIDSLSSSLVIKSAAGEAESTFQLFAIDDPDGDAVSGALLDSQYIQVTTEQMTIDGALDMDAAASAFRMSKATAQSIIDGAYFGRDGLGGFALNMSRTGANGVQSLVMSDAQFTIKNAVFLFGSVTFGAETEVTSSGKVALPAGAKSIQLGAVGGGGEGASKSGTDGVSGGDTIASIYDGDPDAGGVLIATLIAEGGSGGRSKYTVTGSSKINTTVGLENPSTPSGYYGHSSEKTPRGDGGNGEFESAIDSQGAGDGDRRYFIRKRTGEGGNAGQFAETFVDLTSVSNPWLETTIGAGGAGGSSGYDGQDGAVYWAVASDIDATAGAVAHEPIHGTFAVTSGVAGTFPDIGTGIGEWLIQGAPANMLISTGTGTITVNGNDNITFRASQTPTFTGAHGSSATVTYQHTPTTTGAD